MAPPAQFLTPAPLANSSPACPQTFALNATECAEVLELLEAGKEKSFFHDPNKMSQ